MKTINGSNPSQFHDHKPVNLRRIPGGYTCHFVRPGWRLPSRKVANEKRA